MKLTIGEAREFVRARLDELAAQESDMLLNAIDDRNLDKTIDTLIEDAVTYIHLAAPASMMEGPILTESDFPMGTLEIDKRVLDIDTALAQTEDEILRLISFQCGDSEIKLTSAFYEDTTEARMQLNRHIQGQPDSPVLVRMDDSPNYKPHFKYYTTDMNTDGTGRALHFVLRYFSRPKLQGGGGDDPDDPGAAPTVYPSSIVLAAAADQKNVTIVSESAWRITSNVPDWLTVSDLNGTGSATITLSTLHHYGDDLVCQLTFTNEYGSATLEVTKRGQSHSIGDDNLVVAGTVLINGTVSLPSTEIEQSSRLSVWATEGLVWTATLSDTENFLVAPATGIGTGPQNWSYVYVRAKNENNTGIERRGTLTFSADGVDPIVVNLRQPSALTVTPRLVGVENTAGTQVFTISTESAWEITFLDDPDTHPEGFGVSAYSGTGNATVTCTYPQNNLERTRLMNFRVTGGGTTVQVVISQAAGASQSISVRPGTLGPYPASGDISGMVVISSVTATSTWAIDLSTLPTWATIQKVGDSLRVTNVQENISSDPNGRNRRVKVYLETDTTKYAEVEISQSAPESNILLQDNIAPVSSVTVPSTGGTYQASLTASGAWHLTTAYSWIHITSATSGTGNATVTFRVDSGNAEDGSIVASLDGTSKKSTYDIFRQAPPVDDSRIELTRHQNSFYNNVELSADDQYAAFDVRCYGAASQTGTWRISTNDAWIREDYNSWSGTGTGTGWFHADMNSGNQRTGEIVGSLYDSDDRVISTSTFYVIQAGGTGPSLGAYFLPSSVDSDEHTVRLNIVASPQNLIWSIDRISDGLNPARISGAGSSVVSVDVDEYTGSLERSLSLRVYNTSYQREATATITQLPPSGTTNRLSISPFGTLEVAHNTTSQSISVTSNVSWTASTNSAGVTLSPSSGANNGAILATFGANTSTTQTRTITITVTGGGITKTLAIEQAPNSDSLSVSPASVTLPGSGGSQTITVTSSSIWTLSKSHSWISTSVTGVNTFTISAQANSGPEKEGTVTVTSGGQSRVIPVIQGPAGQLAAEPNSVLLEKQSGSSGTVTVFASGAWEVDENSNIPIWLDYSYSSHAGSTSGETLTFTANSANTDASERGPATIYLKLTDIYDADRITVSVSQKGNKTLTISPEIIAAEAGLSTGTIYVTSNTDWEIIQISDDLVIEEEERSGSGNGTVSWLLNGNPFSTRRTLTATFQTTDGTIVRTFTLNQAGGYITVSPTSLTNVSASLQDKTVALESSASWEVQSKPSWVSLIRPSEGQATPANEPIGVTLRIDANLSTASQRSGQVIFRHKNYSTNPATLSITQAKASSETLEISPSGSVHISTSDGTTLTLSVTSSTTWDVITTQSFGITASPASGTGDGTVTLSVPQNQGGNLRKHKVVVQTRDLGKSCTLEIWQSGSGYSINFDPDVDSLIFHEDTGRQGITVHADQAWTAEMSAPWVGALTLSGAADTDVYVEFFPMFSLTKIQSGTYTITTTGGAERVLHITTVPNLRPKSV